MRRWLVERPKDEVAVTIMKNKLDGTYSFINPYERTYMPMQV